VGVADDLHGTATASSRRTRAAAGQLAEGDFISAGTGGRTGGATSAVREATITVGDAAGTLGARTADEIARVVKSRAGVFRACYQKELNRSPDLDGKVVVEFAIGADGKVVSSTIASGTTLTNEQVQVCLRAQIQRLVFAAADNPSTVRFPFVFSRGG
jgi:hypothetical protein